MLWGKVKQKWSDVGSWGNRASNFNKIVKACLPEVIFEQKPEGLWEMSVPRNETSMCKGPGALMCEDQWGDQCGQSRVNKGGRYGSIRKQSGYGMVRGRGSFLGSFLCEMGNHGMIMSWVVTWQDVHEGPLWLSSWERTVREQGQKQGAMWESRQKWLWLYQDISGCSEKMWDSGPTSKAELTGFSDKLENQGRVHGFWTSWLQGWSHHLLRWEKLQERV